MEQFIYVWLKFGHFVYPIAWIGSVVLGFASMLTGILIGLVTYFIWLVILQIFWWNVHERWIWKY